MIAQFLSSYGYRVFIAISTASMLILMLARRHRYRLSTVQAIIYTLILFITGCAGAKLLGIIQSGMSSNSGMSFYGAVYLVLLIMPIVGMMFKLKPMESLDACAPCGAAMVGFMRFGCYCAGCCGGIPMGNSGVLWPAQLMEGLCDMAMLAFLLIAEMQGFAKNKGYPLFLISYGSIRFILEFIRDTTKFWLGLSHGQWFSIIGISVALLMILGDMIWKKRKSIKVCSERG